MGSRKLSFLKLHEAYQQPNSPISTLSKTFSSAKGPTQAELWYTPEGIEVKMKDVHFIIPLANVVGATFEKVAVSVVDQQPTPIKKASSGT